jgi:long-chain acyl-CoA synthetase
MFPGTIARRTPGKPAVIIAGTGACLTYRQLEEASARFANVLYERGLRRGDTLCMLTGNQLTAFEIYWAAMRSGLYLTAVNHHLSADEVAYIVNDSAAKALVVAHAQRDLAAGLLSRTPGIQTRFAFGGEVSGYDSYEGALAAASAEPRRDQPRGSTMLYSSGTTGQPKGIKKPLPERQVDEPGDPSVAMFTGFFGMGPDTVYLSPAPVYHAAPLGYSTSVQAMGGTVIMMERFDPLAALAAIETYAVTHLQMVPTMFVRLLKLDQAIRTRHDLSSLTMAIHAAAPCPPEVKRAMIDWWGPILTEYYGATEGHGVTMISSADWLRKPGSVGTPILGRTHICGDDGTELAAGSTGLVYFERDELPFVYHNDADKTVQARHPRHPTWTTVGDVGYLDSDGYLFLADRQSCVIISGGINIYPQEIENALTLHPKVYDVAVIGVPDPEMGQQVRAIVQPADGVVAGPGLATELTDFLSGRIAHFKLPRSVEFVSALPRTPTGKLLKRKLIDGAGGAGAGPRLPGSPSVGG